MDDRELLDEFVKNRSQRAFRELVERHLPVVYSAARRMVRDACLAEEIAQNVFTTLVQKAESIRPPLVLGGWLYNTTRHLAMHAVRSEQRRREREQTAVAMQSLAPASPDSELIMEHLEPAMAELNAEDRDALVLRFLGDRGLRDLGVELGISEEAARKRVTRALERLRGVLEKRSITASTVLLSTALGTSGVPVPSGLGATIASSALGAAVHGSASLAAGKTFALGSLQKSLVATALGLAVAAGTGALLMKQNGSAQAPADPAALAADGADKAKTVSGVLKSADGKAVSGAEVFLSTVSAAVAIYSAPSPEVVSVLTDASGRFSFPANPENCAVIVVSDLGYGQATITELKARPDVVLQPWAHVEGTLRKATKALANQTIHLSRTRFGSKLQEKTYRTVHDVTTRTDGAGHYVFPRVAPGDAWISWRADPGRYDVQYRYFDIQPGENLVADIGGRGRPVIGRAVLADSAEPVQFFGSVWPKTPHMMRRPPNWQGLSPEKQASFIAEWETTPDAKLYNQEKCPIDFRLSKDGAFTVPDLPAGDYRMTVASWSGAPVTSRMLSRGTAEISIPEMPGERSDEPLDLGEVTAYSTAPLRAGDRAPYFESLTLDGKTLKLSDYAGRNVLLHFWRSDVPESVEAIPSLKAVQAKWGQDKRLALIGVNFDDSLIGASQAVNKHQVTWTQCFISKQSDVVNKYRLRQPTIILIGADGRIIQPQLGSEGIASAVEEVLRAK